MGWVGSALLILSIWLVGKKIRFGFMLGFLGNLLWMVAGVGRNTYDLAVIGLIMALLNLRGWYKWGNSKAE